ncbi:MAG: alanine racemase [Clostridia bacterium]|nr:alanine racemase [Clostridia bacterium]
MKTWIDIDLDALKQNYRTACSLTQAKVTCVLKANAYGHGALPIARALTEAGCASFAVSCAREALELRRAGIHGEILVMTSSELDELPELIQSGVTLTAASFEDLKAANYAASSLHETAVVHIKLDTGFHRLGFPCNPETTGQLGRLLPTLSNIRADGIYSHLGLVNRELDERQYERFTAMIGQLEALGLSFPDRHLCDSIGLVRYPEWHMSRVRVGAFLYGVRPSGSESMPFDCLETACLRAKVTRVSQVPTGEAIGYDEALTETPVRVATIQAGYGDGYPRCLSHGRGQVLIRGKRAPVIGLICMDQMMVDVTNIPDCTAGDTATLLGGGIGYGEIADWAHTNRNECLTLLSRRPVRVYHEAGKPDLLWDSLSGEEKPL